MHFLYKCLQMFLGVLMTRLEKVESLYRVTFWFGFSYLEGNWDSRGMQREMMPKWEKSIPAILEYFSWHPFLSHYLLTHPIASKDLIWLFKTRPACNVMNMGGRSKLQEKLANVVGPIGRALRWFCPNNTIKASMLGAADWRMAFQHQENDFNGAHTGTECFKQTMFNWHWMF